MSCSRDQKFFSTIVLVFCFLQIALRSGEHTTEWSVISGIIGYWLPSPSYMEKK